MARGTRRQIDGLDMWKMSKHEGLSAGHVVYAVDKTVAGLIIYWSWNNTLSVAQQWLIQRRTRLAKPSLART